MHSVINQLKETGIAIFDVEGVGALFERFKEIDFDTASVPEVSPLCRRVTAAEINAGSGKQNGRSSIFTSAEHVTDYQELVTEYLELVRPVWTDIVSELSLERDEVYDIRRFRESVGLHRYLKCYEGLYPHCDVDMLSILKTDQHIESDAGAIRTEGDSVVIFAGATMKDFCGIEPLRHWVGEVKQTKFTVGAFIGPNSSEGHIRNGKRFSKYTAGNFVSDYFTPGTYLHETYH